MSRLRTAVDDQGPVAPVVSVTDLQVRYPNGALGASGVNLELWAGQLTAIFGPNGAGKTSTVRAISGYLRSEGVRVRGSVEVASRQVNGWEPHRVATLGLAFVPERRKVFTNLSVADNLAAVGHPPSRSRRASVHDRAFSLFPALADRRSQLAGRLSGGQQQMLAIARALVCEPSALVVDELTLGLHHSLHAPLYDAMRAIAEEGTAVAVVDESTGLALERADNCYLFSSGGVRDTGPPSKFRGSELLAAGYVEAG